MQEQKEPIEDWDLNPFLSIEEWNNIKFPHKENWDDLYQVTKADNEDWINNSNQFFYVSVIAKVKGTSDVYVSCATGGFEFNFIAPDWQLGYDFFKTLISSFKIWIVKLTNKKALLNTYIHIAEKIEKWKERKVKGQQGIRLTPSTLCNICKHRTSYTTCKAFPSGIPSDLHNKLHTEKLPSQNNDIVFELGEEGSKNAGIKPIRGAQLPHVDYTDEGFELLDQLEAGLVEEYYGETR